MQKRFIVKQAGEESGPYESKVLKSMARLGGIRNDALVRSENQTKWYPASRIKGLFPESNDTHTKVDPVFPTESGAPSLRVRATQKSWYFRFADWLEQDVLHNWKSLDKTVYAEKHAAPEVEAGCSLATDNSRATAATPEHSQEPKNALDVSTTLFKPINPDSAINSHTPADQSERQSTKHSSLIKCPDCGRRISASANMCLKCGKPINAEIVEKAKSDAEKNFRNLMIGIGVLFFLGLIGSANKRPSSDSSHYTRSSSFDMPSYEEKALTVSPRNPGRSFEEKQKFAKDAIRLRDVLEQHSKTRGY